MPPGSAPETISILGATGSIGLSTLDLIGRNPDRFEVEALTANANATALAELAIRFRARLAVVADPAAYGELKAALAGTGIEVAAGPSAVQEAAVRPVSRLMAAIVGAAGLAPTLAAARSGATILLANKECLVSAGRLFMDTARRHRARVIPVDSEHCAIFQALDSNRPEAVESVTITASGGPFRTWSVEQMARARPEDALRHPVWSMGAKISIDSATLMNKGLELIEARHLFDLEPERLSVVVHPESIVHGFVTYADGSVIAQLALPDMRTPIAYALAWPERLATPMDRLDLCSVGRLTFESPDLQRFPALALAQQALSRNDGTATVLNAANEIAVNAFLQRRIKFPDIATIVDKAVSRADTEGVGDVESLEDAVALDGWARRIAGGFISGLLTPAG
ncbi:1-deoxy-D-xylulose 5-phosphate reductoisomerase [Tepidamorphus gemmatus]|uniref:1-deoxy-D-xylulose 5-phosphate reductoisomerase n=1 Tax=Tepidamorphus gemmatus TaxID=747076 RepID=A0A4V2UZU9_9HYPH|nr:1-deoxy-D-xylulose-5-phosphate reductoisomerase [Tepidamorphus gemmatus]TCT12603.1 1-deoxy-D-xylulose 5-phosphate reductoisomerase [Tepidamorphus gemmatus]